MIPTMLGITIEKALDLNPELKAAYENEDRLKTLIDVSKTLEGYQAFINSCGWCSYSIKAIS